MRHLLWFVAGLGILAGIGLGLVGWAAGDPAGPAVGLVIMVGPYLLARANDEFSRTPGR